MPKSAAVEMLEPAQAEARAVCVGSEGSARMPAPKLVMTSWTIPRTTFESPAKAAVSEGARVKTNPIQIGFTLTISSEASASFTNVYLGRFTRVLIWVLVSVAYSYGYSHVPGPLVELVRAAAVLPEASAAGSVLPGVSATGGTGCSALRAWVRRAG
eukprot:scaffold76912_cov57-Phaeocystis_antarctica.AAC.6